tara:strand:- start:676 stop:876 length:201 start_codon:yes stop_codon:yes gene_type:complete
MTTGLSKFSKLALLHRPDIRETDGKTQEALMSKSALILRRDAGTYGISLRQDGQSMLRTWLEAMPA